jgi:hypothetical protein
MRNEMLLCACLSLAACASAPQRAETIIPIPCPPKPSLARPQLDPIPPDAAVDQIMVAVKKSMLAVMAFGDEASKQEGCSK